MNTRSIEARLNEELDFLIVGAEYEQSDLGLLKEKHEWMVFGEGLTKFRGLNCTSVGKLAFGIKVVA